MPRCTCVANRSPRRICVLWQFHGFFSGYITVASQPLIKGTTDHRTACACVLFGGISPLVVWHWPGPELPRALARRDETRREERRRWHAGEGNTRRCDTRPVPFTDRVSLSLSSSLSQWRCASSPCRSARQTLSAINRKETTVRRQVNFIRFSPFQPPAWQ